MIINRKQFRKTFNEYKKGLGDFDSPLWIPEQVEPHKPSRWFVCIGPIKLDNQTVRREFYHWCSTNCRGQILCYSSSEEEEWWGFTHKADIFWWLLRWS
jgi:hypothetical protein